MSSSVARSSSSGGGPRRDLACDGSKKSSNIISLPFFFDAAFAPRRTHARCLRAGESQCVEEIRHVVFGVGVGGVGVGGVGSGASGLRHRTRRRSSPPPSRRLRPRHRRRLRRCASLPPRDARARFLLLRLEREVFHLRQVEHTGFLKNLAVRSPSPRSRRPRRRPPPRPPPRRSRVRVLVVKATSYSTPSRKALPLGRLVVVLAGGRLGELGRAVGAHRVALLHGGAEALQRRLRLAEQRLGYISICIHTCSTSRPSVWSSGKEGPHPPPRRWWTGARRARGPLAPRRSLLAGGKRRRAGVERAPELVQRVSAGGGRLRPVSVGCHVAPTVPRRGRRRSRARALTPPRGRRGRPFPGAGGSNAGAAENKPAREKTYEE